MIPASFEYTRASSIDEALQALAGGAKVIAGGQSLLPLLKMRLASAERLVDIGQLRELRGLRLNDDGSASLGPLTRLALGGAEGVIVPIQCEFFALEGLSQILKIIKAVARRTNPDLASVFDAAIATP